MNNFLNHKELVYQFGIWGVIIIWYVVFGYQLLYDADRALNDVIKSHSFWLFSQPPEEKDIITIVAIDQESRQRLNLKWPWPRSTTAQLIRQVSACNPTVIGLDILFSGTSEPSEDKALAAALKSHPQIVAVSMVQSDGVIKPSPEFEKALTSTGFVNRPIEGGKVRSIIPAIQDPDQPQLLSMELELLRNYLGKDKNGYLKISGNELALGEQLKIKLQNGLIPLNYLVYHNKFRIIPAYKVFENQINPLDFKNKIVLIGATDPIIHDEYDTVLGVFPGVTIIANALVMLLSHRFVIELPLYQTMLIGLICGAMIYLVCRRYGLLVTTLTMLLMMAATFLGCIYLRAYDIRLSCLTLFFLQFGTFLAYNIYHYASLIYVRKKVTHKVLFDPISGLFSTRYFKLLTQEKSEKSTALALVGIKIGNYDDLSRQLDADQIRDLTNNITSVLRSEFSLSKKEPMASLAPGVIAFIREKPRIDQVSKCLESFINRCEENGWDLDKRSVHTKLKGLVLYKASGEKIENCDPISQMDHTLNKLNGSQRIYYETVNEIKDIDIRSRINIRNEYDFIVYDWEEKAKDLGRSLRALSEANARLDRLNLGIIKTLARSIDAKSNWTAGHSERVTRIAVRLGKTMGLDDNDQKRLQLGGLLHDVGKIGIPSHILDKPGKLTDEEYTKICEHPAKGALIIEPLEQLSDVIPLVKQHHERFDGKGYPLGLAGADIDRCARIVAVADVFDALRSNRPYRRGMSLEKVVAIIKDGSGTQFDPEVVAAFLQFIALGREKRPIFSRDGFTMEGSQTLNEAVG